MTKFRCPGVLLAGVIAVGVLGITSAVHAVCAGNRCVGEIEQVVVQSRSEPEGRVLVGIDGDERNLDCTPVQGQYVILSPSQPLFQEMYALLLEGLDDNHQAIVLISPDPTLCRIRSVLLNKAADDSIGDDLQDDLGD